MRRRAFGASPLASPLLRRQPAGPPAAKIAAMKPAAPAPITTMGSFTRALFGSGLLALLAL